MNIENEIIEIKKQIEQLNDDLFIVLERLQKLLRVRRHNETNDFNNIQTVIDK